MPLMLAALLYLAIGAAIGFCIKPPAHRGTQFLYANEIWLMAMFWLPIAPGLLMERGRQCRKRTPSTK